MILYGNDDSNPYQHANDIIMSQSVSFSDLTEKIFVNYAVTYSSIFLVYINYFGGYNIKI